MSRCRSPKHADRVLRAIAVWPIASTWRYKGTTVSRGPRRAVVVATGQANRAGSDRHACRIDRSERTPLERRLDALGRRLVWLTLAVAVFVAALGAIQGAPLVLVIETGIALAVAAVPEALPAVATIAPGGRHAPHGRRHALVRRLPAVETLGSTTVVCTDKTRTLTSGEMSVVRVWTNGRDVDMRSAGVTAAREDARADLTTAAEASRQQASAIPDSQARDRAGSITGARDPVDRAVLEAVARLSADWRKRAGQSRCA